jgi:hypothetical protein
VLATTFLINFGMAVPGLSKEHPRSLQPWPNRSTRSPLHNVSECRNFSTTFCCHEKLLPCRVLLARYKFNGRTATNYSVLPDVKLRCDARSASEQALTNTIRQTAWRNVWLVQYHTCVRQQQFPRLVQRKRNGDIRGSATTAFTTLTRIYAPTKIWMNTS